VAYSIVLSPSYRIPVLYLSVAASDGSSAAFVLDHLAPPAARAGLRDAAVLGAVTMTVRLLSLNSPHPLPTYPLSRADYLPLLPSKILWRAKQRDMR
jgi:hypothetical protein